MKEKLSNNKKLFITILIGIAFLISISFAIYNIVLEGQRTHNITTNKLTFSYKEPIESLNLISYNSLTDEEGKKQNTYYEFTVKGTSEAPEVIDYVIYLQKEEAERTFNESDLKVYLTKVENDVETEVVAPTLLKLFSEYNNISDTKALYGSSMNLTGNEDITDTYRLRIWLKKDFDFNSLKSSTTTNGEQNIKIEQYEYKFKVNVATGVMMPITNLDKSGANEPVLATNIIPVYYDETNGVWKKADSNNKDANNKWYDYDNKMWANAVTVSSTNRDTYIKATAGTPISMDDINTMWVWIPRFTATGDTANYNGGTIDNPGAFNITFVDNKTTAHDAFTFGTQSLNGIWVGKFETSHNTLASSTTDNNLGCTSDTCSNANGIIIKPNVESLRYNNVSNLYYANLSMKQSGNSFGFDTGIDTTLDTHMMKNNEWGAVAYLTQSIYGRCTSSTSCTEVYINNSESFYTGRSGETPGSSNTTSTTEGTYKYNENKIETSVVEGTGTNVSTTITNDSTYPWTNTDGVYSSSNNGQDSTTTTLTFSFTLSSKGVVSFDYSVSSDKTWRSWDEMSYTINNGTTDVITGDKISGTTRGTEESSLSYDNKVHILDAGTYTLTFTYSKDSSNADGLDKGYVKNLVILDEVEIITKEVPKGQLASTTGNIYGVYDMSGGAYEYVMGVYTDGTQNWSGGTSNNSGFSGCLGSDCSSTYDGVAYPESKYYNSYTNTGTDNSPITNYTSDMQHALTETKNWFGDYAYFVDGNIPWFRRGGDCYHGSYAGVFSYDYYYGNSDSTYSSRSSLIIN